MIHIGEDALALLPEHVAPPVLVVMDENTAAVAGRAVASELRAAQLCLPADLHATEDVVAHVRAHIRNDVVAVGSGTLTDVVRHAAHRAGRDFLSVPTAASMDGYASGVAALERDGVKLTLPARPPAAIFADPRIAAAAPVELTRAGVGDLLAKATARVDWLAAHLLYGEEWRALEAPVLPDVTALLAGDVDAVEALLRELIESGLTMAAVGSSRPASGCEHHASHLWDLLAVRGLRPRALHGLQVGYATGFAMRLQRFAFGGGISVARAPRPVPDPLDAAAREWIGDPPAAVVRAVADKQRATSLTPSTWPDTELRWEGLRERLAPSLRAFDVTARALRLAGIPDRSDSYLGIGPAMLRAGLRYGGRLRSRYTVVDFLEGQGVLEEALDQALDPRHPG